MTEFKQIKYILVFLFISLSCGRNQQVVPETYTELSTIKKWYTQVESNHQVYQQGIVSKILKDDTEGSQHQKFVLQLENNQTILISHNIDLAQRIPHLSLGDTVIFYGEYEWNPKGGIVHWTHHDPKGRHAPGFLKHKNEIYQ